MMLMRLSVSEYEQILVHIIHVNFSTSAEMLRGITRSARRHIIGLLKTQPLHVSGPFSQRGVAFVPQLR